MSLRKTRDRSGAERVWWWCPGCDTHHAYTVKLGEGQTDPPTPCWSWNGNLERPTFTPSLLCNGSAKPADLYPNTTAHRCHVFVTDGQVRYLGDCTHELAGKTIPIEGARFGS